MTAKDGPSWKWVATSLLAAVAFLVGILIEDLLSTNVELAALKVEMGRVREDIDRIVAMIVPRTYVPRTGVEDP